jgi:hypothetical protein
VSVWVAFFFARKKDVRTSEAENGGHTQ